MLKNKQIVTYLCEKFSDIPFKVYVSHKQQVDLVYAHGEIDREYIPYPSAQANKKYIIQSDGNKLFLAFFYPEDVQVLICLYNPNIDLSADELNSLYVIFSFLEMEQQVTAKEAILGSMIESIRSITSTLELNDVLNKIITHALSVIPAADAGYLQLYDEKAGGLVSKAAVRFNEKLDAITIKSGESITGKVYRDGIPVIYASQAEMYEGMATLSKENFNYIHGSIDLSKLKAMISVPLFLENKTVGVMTVHQYESEGKLNIDDLHLLEGFAAQAAIAIHNAKLYEEAHERLKEITELSKQLEDKNRLLLKRAEIHETLTRLSLQNKSVEFIIRELNRMMNCDVYFFDYLDTELFPKKSLTYPYLSHDELSRIFTAKSGPFYLEIYDQQSEMEYFIYPLLSDRVVLGCFNIPLFKPISPQDIMTIEQASSVLALELTKRKTQAEVYYKKKQELFNDLTQYKDPHILAEVVESIGFNPNALFSVFILEASSNHTDIQVVEANIHRLISRIKRRIPESGTLIFGYQNKVTILFSSNHPNEMDELTAGLRSFVSKWGNHEDVTLYAGLSSPYQGIQSIAKCNDEAIKALSYAINRKLTEMIDYKKIGINRLFLSQPSPEIESFADDILAPLRTEKSQNNDLEHTLFTYIKMNKSITDTADKLHIHKNTLYHRIKKIEDLLQLEFNNPDDFLQILLACHLHESFLSREK